MKISQREAKRLRARVRELERQEDLRRRSWVYDWPGGFKIVQYKLDAWHPVPTAIRTARKLQHAVVVTASDDGMLRFIGLPLHGVKS